MAFLDNSGDIILDAVLTETGRRKMAAGTFKITKFALGDDEINYALYDLNHPSGSAYADLEILQINNHTPFRMFLSGGLSYRQFVPSASFGFFTNIEKLLSPFHNTLGSFMTIVVKKLE